MIKKISMWVPLAISCTFPCFAGFYAGASIGPEGASFSQKAHVFRPSTFDAVDKQQYSGTGFFGSLFAGYGRNFDKYYLAAEMNGNLSSVKHQRINDEYVNKVFSKTTFKMDNSVGMSLLPGYFLSESTLAYGRIGYANGHLKTVEADPTVRSFNTHRSSIRYGLGVRHALTPRWILMMDYSQINYQSINSSVFDPFGTVTKYAKITPNTAQVGFGILYNFDAPVYVK